MAEAVLVLPCDHASIAVFSPSYRRDYKAYALNMEQYWCQSRELDPGETQTPRRSVTGGRCNIDWSLCES